MCACAVDKAPSQLFHLEILHNEARKTTNFHAPKAESCLLHAVPKPTRSIPSPSLSFYNEQKGLGSFVELFSPFSFSPRPPPPYAVAFRSPQFPGGVSPSNHHSHLYSVLYGNFFPHKQNHNLCCLLLLLLPIYIGFSCYQPCPCYIVHSSRDSSSSLYISYP